MTYYFLDVEAALIPPPGGLATTKHHKLNYNRARRFRRYQESRASEFLSAVEAITRFPALVIGPETPYKESRPLRIRSYALERELVERAGSLVGDFFVAGGNVKTGVWGPVIF